MHSTECLSPKQRRWPEDIAWHPEGNRLFAVYTADGGDNQISVLNLNKSQVLLCFFLFCLDDGLSNMCHGHD